LSSTQPRVCIVTHSLISPLAPSKHPRRRRRSRRHHLHACVVHMRRNRQPAPLSAMRAYRESAPEPRARPLARGGAATHVCAMRARTRTDRTERREESGREHARGLAAPAARTTQPTAAARASPSRAHLARSSVRSPLRAMRTRCAVCSAHSTLAAPRRATRGRALPRRRALLDHSARGARRAVGHARGHGRAPRRPRCLPAGRAATCAVGGGRGSRGAREHHVT